MAKQTFVRKALAVVLSVALLMSCAVFSFGANAEDTLMWENNFDTPTSSNWYSVMGGESDGGPWNSGTVKPGYFSGANYAVYNDGGYMALGFKSWNARNYLSGFMVRHHSATDKNTAGYGSAGGSVYETGVGAFSPEGGKYRIELDYKVNAFPDSNPSAIDVCVGFASQDTFYWDSDRDEARFASAGSYQSVGTVGKANLGDDWTHASIVYDLASNGDQWMHVFLKNSGTDTLDGAEVLIDNIEVYKVTGGGTTPTPPPPTGEVLWENDYENPTSSNWYSALKGEADGGLWNSGTVLNGMYNGSNYAVYNNGGYMALGYKNGGGANGRKYLSGFAILHKEATDDTNVGSFNQIGLFSPDAGQYTIEFDYQLASFIDSPYPAVDVCVGYANSDNFQWDGDRDLARFTGTTGDYPANGNYVVAATLSKSDVSTTWHNASVTLNIPNGDSALHIFLKNGTQAGATEDYLEGTEVLVDNVKVSLAATGGGGGGETPGPEGPVIPSDPDIRWENDYENGSASNWYGKLGDKSAVSPWNSGTVKPGVYSGANYAVFETDKDGGHMALGFQTYNASKFLSGFHLRHKYATDRAVSDAYGTAGGAEYETQYGAFRPLEGSYKIELEYKVTAFPDTPLSKIDICVGVANWDSFYWDGDRSLDRFLSAGGAYQTIASVGRDDVSDFWQNGEAVLTVPQDANVSMHIFLVHNGNDTLEGAEVLLDNITVKVTTVDDTPDGPVLMWKNAFDNGNNVNWASAYGGKEDGSYWNSGKVHTDHKNYSVIQKDGDNGYMALGFANEDARVKLSGFVFLHEEATHNFSGQYGYGGGYPGTPQGRVYANPGYYIISFDYKLASFTDAANASMDFGVSFCGDLLWDGAAGVDKGRIGAFGGDPKTVVTVTKDNLGDDWAHVTCEIANLSADSMFLYFFAGASDGYKGTLEGCEIWVDNFEISQNLDESLFTKITFFYDGRQVGQSKGGLPGMYFTMPTLNLPAIPEGHKVVYYSDSAYKNVINTPTEYPEENMKVYIRIVKDTGNTWGFETEAKDTLLSLNPRIPETILTVDDAYAHSGTGAVRVNSDGGLGSPNLWPQMMVKNGFGQQVVMTKGRDYQVKFHLYIPAGQDPYEISYWLTASDDDSMYDKDYDAAHSIKNYLLAEGKQAMSAAGEWVEVTVTIPDCPYDGLLRIGLNGDKNKDHPFYLDDLTVIAMPADTDTWSFETEGDDTLLSVNPRIPETTITVDTSSAVFSGIAAARVNSDGGLGCPNLWPQMFVKNGAGEQIYVYQSRSYEVKLYMFIPEGQPVYDVSYWLTATEEEEVFNRDYEHEYSVKNFRVAEGVAQLGTLGTWHEVTIAINDCPLTGKLRIGFNGNGSMAHPFYIDDILVYEVTQEPDDRAESYESYDDGKEFALNTDGSSMAVTGEDRHSGDNALKIVTRGNNVNAAPQMAVTDIRERAVKLEKGKNYHVTFWVSVPIDQADYDLKYWLAIDDSNDAFTLLRKNVVVDTQTVTIRSKQAWQLIRASITDCKYSGTLRLGITGTTNASHTFYLDDIYVKEVVAQDKAAMNFEMYEPGTTLHINEDNNTFTVSDAESYTGGQSVYVHADNNHENRPQLQIRDAEGNQIKVKKGDNFYVTFMVYIPETEPYFNFSYYVAAVPDDVVDKAFRYRTSFVVDEYKLGGQEWTTPPPAGEWTQIKIAVLNSPLDGNLRIGLCHGNGHPFESNFYVDDIKVYEPEYVQVKFDTNGSEDTFEDLTLLSDMLVPYDGIDPYREGYEFLGWYTDKNFSKDSFFDIYTQPIVGKTGDVVTLYARWRKWDDTVTNTGGTEEMKYKVEYYEEKVWVGDQNVPENPYTTGAFDMGDPEPVVVTPDTPDDSGALPPWLIVVIIAAAVVVVGGGAVLAAVLIKKSKKA